MKTTAERSAAITARRNPEVIEETVVGQFDLSATAPEAVKVTVTETAIQETKVETTVKKPRKPRVKKQPEA